MLTSRCSTASLESLTQPLEFQNSWVVNRDNGLPVVFLGTRFINSNLPQSAQQTQITEIVATVVLSTLLFAPMSQHCSVVIPVDWSHSFPPQSLSRVIPLLVETLLYLTWKLRNSSISKHGKECPLTVLFGRHANKDIVKPLMIIITLIISTP